MRVFIDVKGCKGPACDHKFNAVAFLKGLSSLKVFSSLSMALSEKKRDIMNKQDIE